MKINAAICIGLAFGASALTSSLRQRGPLVTTLANDVPLEFVRTPPGEFMMGCPDEPILNERDGCSQCRIVLK